MHGFFTLRLLVSLMRENVEISIQLFLLHVAVEAKPPNMFIEDSGHGSGKS